MWGCLATLLAYWASITVLRNGDWMDEERLFIAAQKVGPVAHAAGAVLCDGNPVAACCNTRVAFHLGYDAPGSCSADVVQSCPQQHRPWP